MIRNYITTAYRNLQRNKVYAVLNIAGLALGVGCALVIYKVIDYELSFDRHHSNYDNIYRAVRITERAEGENHDSGSSHPLAAALKSEFPTIKETASIDYQEDIQINIKNDAGIYQRYLDESGVVFAQPEIFKIFDITWLTGNPEEALKNPNEVVLSTKWMSKFFGLDRSEAHQAMGRIVNIDGKKDLVVVGIYEDFPETTDYPFKMMVSYETLDGFSYYYNEGKSWTTVSSSTNCMVLLNNDANPADIERQLPDFIDKYIGEGRSQYLTFKLQPFSDIHFNQKLYNYPSRAVNPEVLLALAIIGLLLVVTACINFVNLATAQAIKRSKEIGIRKVMGGHRLQLAFQFLSETFIITLVAVLVSLGVAELLMVNLTDVLSYRLHLNLTSEPLFILFVLGLTMFVGLLSGFYPSFLLSRIDPIRALKAKMATTSTGGYSLRRALVIFQFGMSQLLIISTLIVSSQMDYFHSKQLGFERDGIMLTYLPDNNAENLDRLKKGLLSHPEIEAVSFNLSAPFGLSDSHANFNYLPANLEEDPHANFKLVDEHYIDVYGMKLLAGRKLMKNDSNNVVVNMEVVKLMGFENPDDAIGESLKGGGFGWFKKMNIVGVLENFHSKSLAVRLDFVIMMYGPTNFFYEAGIKFRSSRSRFDDASKIVEAEWLLVYPNNVFDFDFYDQQLLEHYEDEQGMAKLLTFFAAIAIFIGCLGLYGLITFMSNQKTKEIGVRKALGASVADILKIFSKELIILLLVAFVIAAPIALFSMEKWLSNFEYHIEIGPGMFMASIAISLAIALITMGHKSVKSALSNPSESLKDE